MAKGKEKKFMLLHNGDFLRDYAKSRNMFLYPYDIRTGSDISVFRNMADSTHFVVFSMDEMKPVQKDGVTLYEIRDVNLMFSWEKQLGDELGTAISHWNSRTQHNAKVLLKPVLQRFVSLESKEILVNLVIWAVISAIQPLYTILHEYALAFVFMLICSNARKVLFQSYGEEIPRKFLQQWADSHGGTFSGKFYENAMLKWEDIRKNHEDSLPLFVAWRRKKYRFGENYEEDEEMQALDEPATPSEVDYCQEIRDTLNTQIDEFNAQKTKISDKAIKGHIEDLLSIL